MYICICKAITDHQIRQAVEDGAHSLRAVQTQLDIANQCGKCGQLAREIIRQTLSAQQGQAQPLWYSAV